jgi:hypothetical protein
LALVIGALFLATLDCATILAGDKRDSAPKATQDADKDAPKEKAKDVPKDAKKDTPIDAPKEKAKDAPKDTPKDAPKPAEDLVKAAQAAAKSAEAAAKAAQSAAKSAEVAAKAAQSAAKSAEDTAQSGKDSAGKVTKALESAGKLKEAGDGTATQAMNRLADSLEALVPQPHSRRTRIYETRGLPATWDLRDRIDQDLYVYHQRGRGYSWAFAGAAAYQANVAYKIGELPAVSVQYLIDRAEGGHTDSAFRILYQEGTPTSFDVPFRGRPSRMAVPCRYPIAFRAAAYGLVHAHRNQIPDAYDIKKAILKHGAVVVGYHASDKFLNFKAEGEDDDVFTTVTTTPHAPINHALLVIGWDDHKLGKKHGAWLVQNSQGRSWGYEGFAWIPYSDRTIGAGAAWVDAVSPVATSGDLVRCPPSMTFSRSAGRMSAGSRLGVPCPPAMGDSGYDPLSDEIRSRLAWWNQYYNYSPRR